MERIYVIPLRREFRKVPKYKRAKKAVTGVKDFLTRHMKPGPDTKPKLGKYLNLELWKHGIRNPPPRVKVTATKDDKGQVWAELFGAPVKTEKKETKKEKPAKNASAQTIDATVVSKTQTEKQVNSEKADNTSNNEMAKESAKPVAKSKKVTKELEEKQVLTK